LGTLGGGAKSGGGQGRAVGGRFKVKESARGLLFSLGESALCLSKMGSFFSMASHCIVLIPIYRPLLEPLEEFSVDLSVRKLFSREMLFLAPEGLDTAYYQKRYPFIAIQTFPAGFFASIHGYNQLLLNPAFYQMYAQYEFMLILQTDAIVLRDELSEWMARPYDYIGAPWPVANELVVQIPPFDGDRGRHLRIHVGNGGLSLRRNQSCIELLNEYSAACDMFIRTGSSEDLFFSFMGSVSKRFILPNEVVASEFSLEISPEQYIAMNAGRLPMGAHAWWKHAHAFWMAQFSSGDSLVQAV